MKLLKLQIFWQLRFTDLGRPTFWRILLLPFSAKSSIYCLEAGGRNLLQIIAVYRPIHDILSQKTVIFISTTVRISHFIKFMLSKVQQNNYQQWWFLNLSYNNARKQTSAIIHFSKTCYTVPTDSPSMVQELLPWVILKQIFWRTAHWKKTNYVC